MKLKLSNKKKRYKEFILYFETLDKEGLPYGISDLKDKAIELNLPIPKITKIGKLIWDKVCDECKHSDEKIEFLKNEIHKFAELMKNLAYKYPMLVDELTEFIKERQKVVDEVLN